MKKHLKIIAPLTFALIACAIAFGALAAADVRYVNTGKLNAYKTWDTEPKVIKTLKGGDTVFIEDIVDIRGRWAMIMVEDTKHGGQKEGFVRTKYLSSEMPEKYCKHDWGKWKVPQEATCTEKGKRSRTCRICGNKETEPFYDEHTWDSWKLTKEPTCTQTGARERTCKVCGKVVTQTLDKLPHEYQWKEIVETTDHSAGTRARSCVNCGQDGGEEDFDSEGTLRCGDRSEAVYHMQRLLVEQAT